MSADHPRRGLNAVGYAHRRRARDLRTLLWMTASVSMVSLTMLLILPGMSPVRPRVAPSLPSGAEAPRPLQTPRVVVREDAIVLDGGVLIRTEGIDRLQRIEPLYAALEQRSRIAVEQGAARPRRLELDVARGVPAIVVKSVVQTAALAGYSDLVLALPDGGAIELR